MYGYNRNPLLNGNVVDPIDQMRRGEWLRLRLHDIDTVYYGGHRAMHSHMDGSRLREVSKHRPKHLRQTVTATLDDATGRIMSGIDPRAIPREQLPQGPL